MALLLIFGLVSGVFAQHPTGNQTRRTESFPAYTPDGETLYYGMDGHPQNLGPENQTDIWVVRRQTDGSWSKPIICGAPVNTFGHDRVIGMGAGGDKLAVLRLGTYPYVDVLAKGERAWRITSSWPLDRALAFDGFPHFDLENRRLFYQDTLGDLHVQTAGVAGDWSEAKPLTSVNSSALEGHPYLALDGKTFYFKRDGKWMYTRLAEQGLTAEPAQLVLEWQGLQIASISFAVEAPQRLAICGIEEAGKTKVRAVPIPGKASPELCRVLKGKVQLPPGPGTSDTRVTLQVDGQSRQVEVDQYGNYALVVSQDADGQVLADAPGYFAPARGIGTSIASNAYAADHGTAAIDQAYLDRTATIQDLSNRIYRSQEALNELRARRRQADIEWRKQLSAAGEDVLENYIDPELEALRFREANARAALADTLPPRPIRPTVSDSLQRAIDSIRYAELIEMRARFQNFQDDELARRGQAAHDWENTTEQTPERRKLVARTIEQDWAPAAAQEVLQEAEIDSEVLATDVSRDLFPSSEPAVYERQAWENELLSGVRPQAQAQLRENLREPIERQIREREQIAQQTDEYETEIQRLNDSLDLVIAAQLQAEREPTPVPQAPIGRDLRVKTVPQPSTYQTTSPRPQQNLSGGSMAVDFIRLETGRKTILEQVTFQPGSAYLGMGADSELQRLLGLLQSQPSLKLMLGVHMGSNYSFSDAQAISQGRKSTLSAWFVERGIEPDRVFIEAYGRSRPLPVNSGSNSGDERVELVIR